MADVVVIGGGLIGLSAARALASEGLTVAVIGRSLPGEASPAAAGMLAPSVERSAGPAHDFAVASRDRFPEYLLQLNQETGVEVPLNRLGILQVAISRNGEKGLRKSVLQGARWIDAKELHELEPALIHGLGAVFSPDDGCVDNTILLEALAIAIAATPGIQVFQDIVTSIRAEPESIEINTASGEVHSCGKVVIAAGAWVSQIRGTAFGQHVRPVRGQMLSYDSAPLRHVVYGPRGYLVPRPIGHTLAGSTMEDVGYKPDITTEGVERVASAAEEICPSLAALQAAKTWAGLRPVTPDMMPMIGPDPAEPRLVYACGHSRNGVLLAPLTAEIVADLVVGRRVKYDLTQFRPDRFQY